MFVIYIHSCLKIEWHQEELINVCITLLFVEFGRENGRNEVWEKYINLEAIFYIFSIVTDYPTRSIIFCISKNMRTISAKVSYKKRLKCNYHLTFAACFNVWMLTYIVVGHSPSSTALTLQARKRNSFTTKFSHNSVMCYQDYVVQYDSILLGCSFRVLTNFH